MSRGGVSTPEELFWEIRRPLESLAAERPVMLHVDDLHWGEQMLLELLAHIADLSRGAPMLLLCAARPELVEEHPEWPAARSNAMVLSLGPLSEADSAELVGQLDDRLAAEAQARLIKASEGNPLFLQEMVALAREQGDFDMPPTIQALLAARIERLTPEERDLLERGAVEGEVFHSSAVLALGDAESPSQVERLFASLVRKELVRPHPANVPGEEAFRFRHLLIRDAAYDRVPKARRAALHERYERWLAVLPSISPRSTRSRAGTSSRSCATSARCATTSNLPFPAGRRKGSMPRGDAPATAATWLPRPSCSNERSTLVRRMIRSRLMSPSNSRAD